MRKGFVPVVVLVLVVAVVGIGYFFYKQTKPTQPMNVFISPTQEAQKSKLKIFHSSATMNFSIKVPEEFDIEEEFGTVIIANSEGVIKISRNGTNFDNLHDYIEQFDSRRNLISREETEGEIDGSDYLARILTFPGDEVVQKSYYVYSESFVYIFSSDSESLYSDLDQIAQSFKYEP